MAPTRDSTLADPQQVIAGLQRQLAEALARETVITEVLQIINASPGDLASVFQAMVEKALRLCDATRGTLRTYDGENFQLAAAAQGEALALPDAGRGQSSLFRRFVDGEQIVHLADVLSFGSGLCGNPVTAPECKIFGVLVGAGGFELPAPASRSSARDRRRCLIGDVLGLIE
jgi:hypothetical protein